MKISKRVFALLLCVIICFSVSFSSLAANDTATIKVSSTEALPGDTVTINVEISNNPGIMAMAFCITYDSNALAFKNYSKGYLSSYTVKDHSDKGHVSFVNVENKDISTDGTIISLLFEVKEDAKPGKHTIALANSNREKHGTKLHNSFSNSKQQFVVPFVTSGGVTVGETCKNAGHKYSEWNIVYPATCTSSGLRNRLCERCSTFDEETIPAAHDFESDWTVDKAATPEEDGIMSRHCTKCDMVTDKIIFSYEEIGGDDDTSSDDVLDDNSGDSDSSSQITSNESDTAESSSSSDVSDNDTSNTPSETAPNKKPIINNVVGEKVPLAEAEKLENYQQIIKPDTNNSDADNSSTDNDIPSNVTPDSSDVTTDVIPDNNTSVKDKEPSFFATTGGIITIILCSALSIGILVLGVLLILRNKNSDK